ncbi:hypothetical protein SAMN04488127_2508 [Bhargavaea ginsengi]|uniref:Uncharacterized protein n=1 Tax=Bhargavaea ginsengi TaxID=426757 RepID=A0A1H7B4E2_9BACL|nr:hypothetical protein SAMN04488127_2508 [Bhargavaea ginsengi]
MTIFGEMLIKFIETLTIFYETLINFIEALVISVIMSPTQNPRQTRRGFVCPYEFRFIPAVPGTDWIYRLSNRGAVLNRRAHAAAVRMIDGIM